MCLSIISIIISVVGVICSVVIPIYVCRLELKKKDVIQAKHDSYFNLIKCTGKMISTMIIIVNKRDVKFIESLSNSVVEYESSIYAYEAFVDSDIIKRCKKFIKRSRKFIMLLDTDTGIAIGNTENGIWCDNKLYRNRDYVLRDLDRELKRLKDIRSDLNDRYNKMFN